MELRHIRYFVAVAEELHMGRAAKRLHISQPPLSMQIANLERELGLQLFLRVGRGLELSDAGREFLKHAYYLLDGVGLAVRATQRANQGEVGELALGFVAAMSYSYLPEVLRSYRRRYPNVAMTLHEWVGAQQLQALGDGRLHVGLLRPPVEQPGLTSEIILREPYLVALPYDHPLTGDPLPLEALSREPFIMFPQRIGGRFYEHAMALCHHAGFTPKVVHEATQLHTIVGLVGGGLGLAIVPASARLLSMQGVRYAGLADGHLAAEIAMAWRTDDKAPATLNFLAVARTILSERQAGMPGELPASPMDRQA
ncbi:MAG: LysR family transcriptional regulator [Pigmentiphaga sp.]|nr:LysR family transcriptional regulator [Pigmentiphaga sp.]